MAMARAMTASRQQMATPARRPTGTRRGVRASKADWGSDDAMPGSVTDRSRSRTTPQYRDVTRPLPGGGPARIRTRIGRGSGPDQARKKPGPRRSDVARASYLMRYLRLTYRRPE